MQKKEVIYLSILTLLFSLVLPILAIAPLVYFILLKNSIVNWLIFISIFCLSLFLIYALGWFNSSSTFSAIILNYLYNLLQLVILPFLFSIVYYLFLIAYKKFNSSIIVFILITAIPFTVLLVLSLIFMKTKGFSFVEFAPVFEQLFGKNAIDGSVEKFLTNLINYEIPKSISLISICISLLIEQQLVSHTKKKEELKYLIKPISSARLSRGFSWITIIAIYSLLILKFVLRIKNFPLELILYNIFYLLTTIHFINGIGVIAYYYNLKIVPILNTNLIPQIKTRPFTLLLIILAIFVIILFLMPFFIYIYFVIAFISTVDTIYPLRKENVL